MDKNTLNALILIALLFFVYSMIVQPPPESQQTTTNDTTAVTTNTTAISEKVVDNTPKIETDSLGQIVQKGLFEQAATAEEFVTLENDLVKVKISNKGGRIYTTELKDYKTYAQEPLILIDGDQNLFNYHITIDAEKKAIDTKDYFFKIQSASKDAVTLRLYYTKDSNSYIEQSYRLTDKSYIVDYDFNIVGFEQYIDNNRNIQLEWKTHLRQQEKAMDPERYTTGVYYKESQDDVSYLAETKDDTEEIGFSLDWVSFKQQFFNSTLIADKAFKTANLEVKTPPIEDGTTLEIASADLQFSYKRTGTFSFPMHFYMGPNQYKELKALNYNMEEMIPLGWGIFGWVNRWLIIPMFDFLHKYIGSFGIIILVLTFTIKLVLFPLTYRSYRSFASMNVLKPEIEALKAKHGDDPQRIQQEQMKLYSQAGVNPLGGCLPQMVQLPILIAMYRFFPASIELRQESFLWAEDLSTYDSIMSLPFAIPAYGDHVSLFCLLSALSTLAYVRINQSMTPNAGGEFAKQMQMFQYIMPVMLLFFFNNFAAGLTYYFFLSNVFSFTQQYAIKNFFIDEEKILAQIQENKKKPAKKSGFQQRLEQMLKEQQAQAEAKQNGTTYQKPTKKSKSRGRANLNNPMGEGEEKRGSNYTKPKNRKKKK
ncbi:MAG: membrane protein insertase YidC [Chitinophagales bacterium]